MGVELVNGDGVLNVSGVDKFMEVNLEGCGLSSYTVVSILGPQSSGKSTILNRMFGTDFREMDASKGRSQTTKGIWMAKAVVAEPVAVTLVIDVEGTDGSARADQDDTTFEKQSALFALAVSDIVLINMWYHEIGRENAANKPLLRIVFQVMMRLFTTRKRTLVFVIRDYDGETPREMLETMLKDEVHKMWDKLPKPQEHKQTPLSRFFNVEVAFFPHHKLKREQFLHEAAKLRGSIGSLVELDRTDVVPGGLAFSSIVKKIWETIKANKDLDLPSINVLIAKELCERIMREKLSDFEKNEEWVWIKEYSKQSDERISDFSKKLNSALAKCFTSYDKEAMYYDQVVRGSYRSQLVKELRHLIQPVFKLVLGHIRSKTLSEFKEEFHRALTQGQMSSSVADDYTRKYMDKFEQECRAHAAHAIEQIELDIFEGRTELRGDFEAFVAKVSMDQLDQIKRDQPAQIERKSKHLDSALDVGADTLSLIATTCSTIGVAATATSNPHAAVVLAMAAGIFGVLSGFTRFGANWVKQKRADQCMELQKDVSKGSRS